MKKLRITGASGFVDGSRNVAKISGRYGAKCLVCSSDQVYQGSCRKGPHREDEEAFSERPRDISMAQEKLNACGIVFTPTVEALVRNGTLLKKYC